MENMLEYKGYHAKVEFDVEDMLFVGSVFGIRDSLNFHGTTTQELIESFHQSIDNYLDMCKEFGRSPDKECKGSFNVSISPELHRESAFAANRSGMTLNQYVEKAIKSAVSDSENGHVYVIAPVVTEALHQQWGSGAIIANYVKTPKEYVQRGVLS